jgi:hypothetical protein
MARAERFLRKSASDKARAMTKMNPRSIRLPIETIDILRDLSDSYSPPRSMSSLANAALRQRVVGGEKCEPTTGKTQPVSIWIDPQFAGLEHAEIVRRICIAVDKAKGGKIPQVIALNREENTNG